MWVAGCNFGIILRKKKNKAKEVLEAVDKAEEKASQGSPKPKSKKTPAELAFLRVQEKRVKQLAN